MTSRTRTLHMSPEARPHSGFDPGIIEALRSRMASRRSHGQTSWSAATEQRLRRLFWALVAALLWLSFQVGQAEAQRLTGQHEWQMGMLMGKAKGQAVPLRIKRLKVRARIDGRLVTTEVTHVFENHTSQVIEGTFSFRLPPHSVLTRLAMSIHDPDKLMEGEIVEKQKARRLYEKIVEEMRDPALLEMKRERLFQTRIYPIPARGKKVVVLQYHHVLPTRGGPMAYHYQLPKLSDLTATTGAQNAHDAAMKVRIDELDLKIAIQGTQDVRVTPYPLRQRRIGGGLLLHLTQKPFRPEGALTVSLPQRYTARQQIWHQPKRGKLGPFVAASLPLALPGISAQQGPIDWILLYDTSADSTQDDRHLGIQAAHHVLSQMGPADAFRLVYGDASQRHFATDWSAPEKRFAAIAHMASQRHRGGSDIGGLLRTGHRLARARTTRIIYIGDGQASLGTLLPEQIVAALRPLQKKKPKAALFGVAVGRRIGHELFRQMTAQRGSYARLLTPETSHRKLTGLVAQLRGTLLTDIKIKSTTPGVALYPKSHPSVTSGTSVVIFAKSATPFGVEIAGKLGGSEYRKQFQVTPRGAAASDALRYYFGARMLAAQKAETDKQRKAIVRLSQRYGVMSRYTSLLVLENDKAYKKHRIKRRKHKERQAAQRKRMAMAKGKRFSDWLRQGRGASPQYQQHGGGTTSKIPQAYWSGGGGGGGGTGGGSGVGVSPDRVQPGDPVIQIKAPRHASSVYVILPHGQIKHARWVSMTNTWMVRFLVPNDLPDGVYHIQVIIVHRSGQIERRKSYYTVDTTAPRLTLRSQRRGGRVQLTATQTMRRSELLASLARRYYKKNKRIPDWGYDVQRVYALTPQKKLIRFKRIAPQRWQAQSKLAPGTRLEISAVDGAGNIRIQKCTVR